MKFGVITFPGSNCDHDAIFATQTCLGEQVVNLWHKDTQIPDDIDCIIIPGGFSYGDYLRCGAIARFSPIMRSVVDFASRGGLVVGICNGFQILTEAQLLPGVLLRNTNMRFICKDTWLRVENTTTPFTNLIEKNATLRIPIAHGEGNYFADADTIKRLEDNNQIVFRYSNEQGEITDAANPNGSINNIAGIINEKGNVLGMMPHPERYSDKILGCDDGLIIFKSIANYIHSK
ncbi:MAG TPA: phosphoribosylformylglycinamidine synthase subunit PurQ [Candidatus Kapabacteria bacterium]|jgi:phosphoribosylformylglycinamidine synthase|nr:phosphoribosylformylglycinamidine synthase subunit PurQ [Candidatus Kapabacteria bacterium]HOM04022.1 phosphoribosylformylglycinamidine synthase subunit PurQ [Candidatus Kapabacteria bacterium]HOQ48364.1 phosphoribosylformylglycinamidine synthase subunit PurQ [Candidatus Kapabacteria bacterium]HPP38828.1 phosphoribosylformylglycinamidine synthase subunit PurQ [Candidatus Kapabacteria bacterium]HPU22621.1 phosphoribosylformylglycinamidine synthase subunit PurQ [Candidatus Kapabacteria bacteri